MKFFKHNPPCEIEFITIWYASLLQLPAAWVMGNSATTSRLSAVSVMLSARQRQQQRLEKTVVSAAYLCVSVMDSDTGSRTSHAALCYESSSHPAAKGVPAPHPSPPPHCADRFMPPMILQQMKIDKIIQTWRELTVNVCHTLIQLKHRQWVEYISIFICFLFTYSVFSNSIFLILRKLYNRQNSHNRDNSLTMLIICIPQTSYWTLLLLKNKVNIQSSLRPH